MMMNTYDRLDSLVRNQPRSQTETENIDPNLLLEIDIDNGFNNNIPSLDAANPRDCDTILL